MQITLNLLAPEKKAALRTGFLLTYAQSMVFILFIVVAFISGTFISLELLLRNTEADLARQTSSTTEQYDSITGQMKQINDYLDRIDGIQQQFTDWSAVLEDLAGAAPDGTRFDSITIAADGTIRLQGSAPTREDVLTMQQQFEGLPFITNVTAPLSNILQPVNPQFEFSMQYVSAADQAAGKKSGMQAADGSTPPADAGAANGN